MATKQYIWPKTIYMARTPTVNDDEDAGFVQDAKWINTLTNEVYRCIDVTVGAAIWYREVFCLDPAEGTCPTPQVEIDGAATKRNVLITPQIYYQDDRIGYDIEIPRNAFSAGPITVLDGYTVTVGLSGNWSLG